MAANFENFLISPDFPINFRKVTKFQRIISKALRVMDKNLWGVGLNRVKSSSKLNPGLRSLLWSTALLMVPLSRIKLQKQLRLK